MDFSALWLAVGIIIVAVTAYDFYTTTLTFNGGGWLTRHLSRALWLAFLTVAGASPERHRRLAAAGPVVLLAMMLFWFGMSWLGWLLIFCGDASYVTNATTGASATVPERLYFAGFTLTTVGYGDFTPASTLAQVLAVLCGFNGLFLVTLSITYAMPVISASAEKRQLALSINALGRDVCEIVDATYSDGSFEPLSTQLNQLSSTIASVSRKHQAYPIIHYFHVADSADALPLNLARLQEALLIIPFAFPNLPAAVRVEIASTSHVISRFLKSLPLKGDEDISPRGPDYSQIRSLGASDALPDEIEQHLRASQTRRHLLRYVTNDGWSWSDVHR